MVFLSSRNLRHNASFHPSLLMQLPNTSNKQTKASKSSWRWWQSSLEERVSLTVSALTDRVLPWPLDKNRRRSAMVAVVLQSGTVLAVWSLQTTPVVLPECKQTLTSAFSIRLYDLPLCFFTIFFRSLYVIYVTITCYSPLQTRTRPQEPVTVSQYSVLYTVVAWR